MEIPAIVLPEKNSLLETLKSLAAQESALADLARAEALKIETLLMRLKDFGCETLTAQEFEEIRRCGSSAVKQTGMLQSIIAAKISDTVEALVAQPVYDLYPLPKGMSCTLSATGRGRIANEKDPFHKGQAGLTLAEFTATGCGQIQGRLDYQVWTEGMCERFEAVSDGLRIDLVLPIAAGGVPDTVLVSGYGIARKAARGVDPLRQMACFALTVRQGLGVSKDQYRLLIFAGPDSCLNHDSGCIVSDGDAGSMR